MSRPAIYKIEGDKLTVVLGQWNVTNKGPELAQKNPRPKSFDGADALEVNILKRK